jgi:two-component system, OmpR family, alkaline phosphatase synthesis response regulator PhoP
VVHPYLLSPVEGPIGLETKRVLVVDDDRSIRRIAQIVLMNSTKWQVEIAGSGPEALDRIKSDRPDVILLDVMMPEMDGVATLGKIREQLQSAVPVIFLTGKTDSTDMEFYSNLGLAGVIEKPFEPTRLANQIVTMVSSWRAKHLNSQS